MGRKGMGRRTAAVAISGVAAVGVLAGCEAGGGSAGGGGGSSSSASAGATSGDDDGGGASGSASGSESGSGQDTAAVQSAYQKTADAKSAKLTMSTTVGGTDGTGSLSLRGSGVIDLANGASDVTLHLGGRQIEERTLDGMLYEKLPPGASKELPAGKTWLKLDLKKAAGMLGGSGATAGMTDPAAPLSYVKGLSGKNVTKVGTETVGGARTTHYRVSVDVAKLAQDGSAGARQLRQQLGDRLPVDLWLDNQGRIRQEEMKTAVKTPFGSGASATASPSASQSSASQSPSPSAPPQQLALDSKLQFTDFGTKADVTAPPARQTVDVTDKITQSPATGSDGSSG